MVMVEYIASDCNIHSVNKVNASEIYDAIKVYRGVIIT
jgi:hypothetical protein